jgi:uncharacterized phage protein (TIGR01671 family)
MSRAIKFRVWNHKHKIMAHIDGLIDFCVGIVRHSTIDSEDGTEVTGGILGDDCSELMQFTGLHDKNGKEIYEGDVIRFYFSIYPRGEKMKETEMVDRVYFNKGAFWLENIADPCYKCLLVDHARPSEIIGNIHENPELL